MISLYKRYGCSLIFFILLVPVQAQEDEIDPCSAPADKKIVKLLDEAAKAKDRTARHQKLKETIEIDPQCGECLFQLGLSSYAIGKEGGRGFDPAINYFQDLEKLCPEYHSDVAYHLGIMYYASDRYAEAAKSFATFQRTPLDDKTKLSKDHDRKLKEVEEILPELAFHTDFFKNDIPFQPTLIANVSTSAEEYLPMLSPDNELLFFTRSSKVKGKG
ncbi:MAG: hypothetical protein M3R08_11225, partial [Bacteroidota bacterium]|nr:hypothetical protein [Bacteroidota bacterium]